MASFFAPLRELKWDVAVLAGRVGVAFVFEEAQGTDQLGSCLRRLDHFVNESSFRGDVGIGELVL